MKTGRVELRTDKIELYRRISAGLLFILFFSLSFPLVIPGNEQPVWLHRAIGWIFIFPVMPLFFYVVDHYEKFRHKAAALYLICFPANGFVFYWAYYSIHVFGGVSKFSTSLLLIVMFAAISTYWLLFLFFFEKARRAGLGRPWVAGVLWVSAETVRTFFPVDFYWSTFGHSQYNNPITLQWSSIGAIYLLSFMIIWISMFVYEWLRGNRYRKEGIVLVSVVFLLTVYSGYRLYTFRNMKPVKEVKLAVMQPSINQYDINSKEKTMDEIITVLTEQINSFDKDTDILVWYEAGMPMRVPVGFTQYDYLWNRYFPDAYYFKNQVVGLDMIDREKREFYNAAGFVQKGKIQKIYRKIKLAPFGEYLPMQDFLFSIGLSTIVPNTVGEFKRGTEHTVYDFGNVKASILICYDGTFSENVRDFVRNGAELLLNISNDAWFGYSSETFQHGSFYPFRAVETGRTIVRAANVGISGVVLPDGSVEHETNLFERTTLNPVVPIYEFDTIYLKFGNWFLYLILVLTGVIIFMSFSRNRKASLKIEKEETESRKKRLGRKRSKKSGKN